MSNSHDSRRNLGDTPVGHYCLPEASDIKYQPILQSPKLKYAELIEFMRKSTELYSSKKSTTEAVPIVHNAFFSSDHTSLTFNVVLQSITFLVSGAVAALVAWIITTKNRKQVNNNRRVICLVSRLPHTVLKRMRL